MQNIQPIMFPAGKTVYGIRAEKTSYDGVLSYTAYRFDLVEGTESPSGHQYAYSMTLKRWKTLEIALMRYSIMGIICFPIFGQRPESIYENEILRLADTGFDKMLRQIQEACK